MRKLIPFLLVLASLAGFSQIPSYYNDVNLNQSGASLKNALATKIIATHTTNLSYTPGVWNALKQADLAIGSTSKVTLIYGYSDTDGNYVTDRTRSKDANGGSAGTQWNREHVYPKSLGTPNLGTSGAGADAHHLRAADISFNSQRSSKKFAAGNGNAGDVTGGWYPGDEWKGDVARMMLYMYVRYGNQCLPKNVAVGATASSDSNMVTLLLQWNAEDPVSAFEKQRNTVIFGIQGNRNPFIDNPALATKIWGGPQAQDLFGGSSSDTQAPTAPTNLSAKTITSTSITLQWTAATDNVGVTAYDIFNGGSKLATATTTSYELTGLTANTNYAFQIKARDAANNSSVASALLNVKTKTSTTTGGGSSALFISEYVEGSSNNKAIEIANFTGSTVNLSDYSLKKATNGAGWGSTLSLSGNLSTGKTYVIAHSSATSTLRTKAQRTDASVLSFNGNDAVGLFKNNVLIDLIGNPTSSAVFAKDKTLRRKSSVSKPNSTYDSSEWTSFGKDDFSGLGTHSTTGTTPTDNQAPTAPSNLVASAVTSNSFTVNWTAATDNVNVTSYDVYANNTKLGSTTATSYNFTSLTAVTRYLVHVIAKDAAANNSPASATISITTKSVSLSYCAAKGNNSSYEYIDKVVFGGMTNTSTSNSGYGDFTNRVANITKGSNPITISAGFAGSAYSENWKIWIDFNQNGTFESSEEVLSKTSSSASDLNYHIQVPTTAKTGKTRMRIVMKWNGTAAACGSFSYGEVEDYSVTIAASRSAHGDQVKNTTESVIASTVYVYPTRVNHTLQFNFDTASEVAFEIINSQGQRVQKGTAAKRIDVSTISNGIYLVRLYDGQKSVTKKFIKQ
ncbi:conserved exported hypothetical protein [Tenacibaculum litopenaei]|uniref:endonuclease n=1 Tax=Tenacibaculum litopenaei TaxID=396016 RepID=UPI0038938363